MRIGTVEVNGLMSCPDKAPVEKEKAPGGWFLTYERYGIKSYYGGYDRNMDSGKITQYFFEDQARAHLFKDEENANATMACGNENSTDILVKLSRPRLAGELRTGGTGTCSRD